MGKRSSNSGKGGNSKRQKSGSLIEPGQYGIFASCNRHRELSASKEFKMILNEAVEKYYPNIDGDGDDEDKDNENNEVEGGDTKKEDIEDAIAKELEEIKRKDKTKDTGNKKMFIREIPINAESLTFFKLRKPIKPSEFVIKICDDLYESKAKNSRFLQKLTGIDKSCNATADEFEKLFEIVMDEYVEEHKEDKFETYSVNLVKRNFDTIDRDYFMELIDKKVKKYDENIGLKYKDADIMINIYCFKNNIGMSVVSYKDYDRLYKFNLQQIFDKSNGLITAGDKKEEKSADKKEHKIPDEKPEDVKGDNK